ncbi:triose-phosphate isomerase [Methylococcus sp. EFPC2]|uniref:triose-phosphate isomerase family protein n=1 Tax=Methylococcus sp. EFPC2 TaxID=2812648 RepID=UPI001967E40F|nr:triose-phosphate isomerase [Methylococcus sp. EFPC2]QSA96723.1 triosephosphate isomerase [Methylococcus sp. EFPC2]
MNTTPLAVSRNYFRHRAANQWHKTPAEPGEPGAIRPFLAGNWKMNLVPRSGVALAARIFDICKGVKDVDIGLAPPYTGLSALADYIKPDFLRSEYDLGRNVFLMAQDTFFESKGAYTGEISPEMLAAIGVDRVIIGHSDRRANLGKFFGFSSSVARRLTPDFLTHELDALRKREGVDPQVFAAIEFMAAEQNHEILAGLAKFLEEDLKERAGESDAVTQRKVHASLAQGLQVILCCGENREARALHETFKLLDRQIRIGLEGVSPKTVNEMIIAYEPVWAIGSGAKAAGVEQISEVHDFIRNLVMDLYGEETASVIRILYGGNVNPENIADIMSIAGVDGALVGGASLKAHDFAQIIRFGCLIRDRHSDL